MFDQLVVSATIRKRSGRWLYFTTTAALWMVALSATIIGGIFAYDARLSSSMKELVLVAPVPEPLLGGGKTSPRPVKPKRVEAYVSSKTPPVGIPTSSSRPPDLSRIPIFTDGGEQGGLPGPPDGVPGGSDKGIRGGIDHGLSDAPPPPPETKKVEPAPPVKTQTVVRQVSQVLQGSAIRRVQPSYPTLAKNAGVSGQVVVEVTIDEEGNVTLARALSGHALLKKVSIDAAYGWKWRPTLLNKVPVKVIGTITFNFQL